MDEGILHGSGHKDPKFIMSVKLTADIIEKLLANPDSIKFHYGDESKIIIAGTEYFFSTPTDNKQVCLMQQSNEYYEIGSVSKKLSIESNLTSDDRKRIKETTQEAEKKRKEHKVVMLDDKKSKSKPLPQSILSTITPPTLNQPPTITPLANKKTAKVYRSEKKPPPTVNNIIVPPPPIITTSTVTTTTTTTSSSSSGNNSVDTSPSPSSKGDSERGLLSPGSTLTSSTTTPSPETTPSNPTSPMISNSSPNLNLPITPPKLSTKQILSSGSSSNSSTTGNSKSPLIFDKSQSIPAPPSISQDDTTAIKKKPYHKPPPLYKPDSNIYNSNFNVNHDPMMVDDMNSSVKYNSNNRKMKNQHLPPGVYPQKFHHQQQDFMKQPKSLYHPYNHTNSLSGPSQVGGKHNRLSPPTSPNSKLHNSHYGSGHYTKSGNHYLGKGNTTGTNSTGSAGDDVLPWATSGSSSSSTTTSTAAFNTYNPQHYHYNQHHQHHMAPQPPIPTIPNTVSSITTTTTTTVVTSSLPPPPLSGPHPSSNTSVYPPPQKYKSTSSSGKQSNLLLPPPPPPTTIHQPPPPPPSQTTQSTISNQEFKFNDNEMYKIQSEENYKLILEISRNKYKRYSQIYHFINKNNQEFFDLQKEFESTTNETEKNNCKLKINSLYQERKDIVNREKEEYQRLHKEIAALKYALNSYNNNHKIK